MKVAGANTSVGQPVDVRGMKYRIARAAQVVGALLVGDDQQHIGCLGRHGRVPLFS